MIPALFLPFIEGKPVTKELTVAYKKHLVESGYAPGSINSMLASLNSLFRFLGWEDCKVKSIKTQKKIYCPADKELTKPEYERLVDAAKNRPRLHLILQTICGTGIRVSELQYFTVEAVRRGEVIVSCKNKTRTILVPGKLKKKLLSYARQYKISSGVIFRTKGGQSGQPEQYLVGHEEALQGGERQSIQSVSPQPSQALCPHLLWD